MIQGYTVLQWFRLWMLSKYKNFKIYFYLYYCWILKIFNRLLTLLLLILQNCYSKQKKALLLV